MTDQNLDPKDEAEGIEEHVEDLEVPAETQGDVAGGAAIHAATPTAALVE